jgi:hypothetical protein
VRRPRIETDTSGSPEERLARAAALQAGLSARFEERQAARREETPARTVPAGDAVLEGLSDAERAVLAGLDLHGRRYGLTHNARAALRKMGCRDLAAVADAPYRSCENWLGYREAEGIRARMGEILAEIRAGAAEPGVERMVPDLDPDTRSWLLGRPVEDVAGRGISRKVAAGLREAGHESLGALATEEADLIEDIAGIGRATVVALMGRLAGIVADGADAPSRGRRRRFSADDDEWASAASD